MLTLVLIALAPVVLILFYIYFRDKYEKEPIGLLIRGFLFGALTVIPVLFFGRFLQGFGNGLFGEITAGYNAFIVASFNEELFKYIAVLILVWRSRHFNEKFDGIVYAVFVSLGFAAVENILYVVQQGAGTGLLRAFTSVPGHAIFGIVMGYYLGLAKFFPEKRSTHMINAFFWPFMLHGIYDYILMSQYKYLLLIFIPFLIYMYIIGFKRMKKHSDSSRFNPENIDK